ncbi:MAG: ATP-binding cassette domain-containing protein [Candidatus Eisenbacteria bacterium]
MNLSLVFDDVTYAYPSSPGLAIEGLGFGLHSGWTGVVGPNGAGKTTVLRLATGLLVPTAGSVRLSGTAIYCEQRTDDPPHRWRAFLESPDPYGWELRGRLGIDDDWIERWPTLSHGERKRVQIAVALWQSPALLAVDEPTNHLDHAAARMLIDALERHQGLGLIVSHDRELLDRLCERCLFLGEHRPVLRPGGYTEGREQAEREQEAAAREQGLARKERRRLEQEASKRRDLASRADRLRSKRGIAKKDHDAKAKIDQARVTGKDATAGRLLNQMQGRIAQARRREESIEVTKNRELGIWMPGGVSPRDLIVHVEAGEIGVAGGTPPAWRLRFPELAMRPTDRVALVGPNGAGKSTLLSHVLGGLTLPEDKLVYIPQEIDRDESRAVIERVRASGREELGRILTVVSHLGSDPRRLLDTVLPSPGEVRKLLLAEGVARVPHLIVLDEPTNHLDLPSIESLEAALRECPCGLLLVSHDERFLERTTSVRWTIEGTDGEYVVVPSAVG